MRVRIERNPDAMLPRRQTREVVIRPIDAINLHAVHINMGVALAGNISRVHIFRRPAPALCADADIDPAGFLGYSGNADADRDFRRYRRVAHLPMVAVLRSAARIVALLRRCSGSVNVEVQAKRAGGVGIKGQRAGFLWGHGGGEVVSVQMHLSRFIGRKVDADGIAPLYPQILAGEGSLAVGDVHINDHRAARRRRGRDAGIRINDHRCAARRGRGRDAGIRRHCRTTGGQQRQPDDYCQRRGQPAADGMPRLHREKSSVQVGSMGKMTGRGFTQQAEGRAALR